MFYNEKYYSQSGNNPRYLPRSEDPKVRPSEKYSFMKPKWSRLALNDQRYVFWVFQWFKQWCAESYSHAAAVAGLTPTFNHIILSAPLSFFLSTLQIKAVRTTRKKTQKPSQQRCWGTFRAAWKHTTQKPLNEQKNRLRIGLLKVEPRATEPYVSNLRPADQIWATTSSHLVHEIIQRPYMLEHF